MDARCCASKLQPQLPAYFVAWHTLIFKFLHSLSPVCQAKSAVIQNKRTNGLKLLSIYFTSRGMQITPPPSPPRIPNTVPWHKELFNGRQAAKRSWQACYHGHTCCCLHLSVIDRGRRQPARTLGGSSGTCLFDVPPVDAQTCTDCSACNSFPAMGVRFYGGVPYRSVEIVKYIWGYILFSIRVLWELCFHFNVLVNQHFIRCKYLTRLPSLLNGHTFFFCLWIIFLLWNLIKIF